MTYEYSIDINFDNVSKFNANAKEDDIFQFMIVLKRPCKVFRRSILEKK